MEDKNNILNKLSNLLFFLSILFFTVGLNLQDDPPSGWYQQFLPDINNMPISDIEFLDSLVGFAVTGDNVGNDTNYIIKTTNGGDNWFINFSARRDFFRVIFINSNTGYVSGGYNAPGVLYKTTNQGNNWIQIPTGFGLAYKDMSILNEDTIWLADDNPIDGGVFRTTNGGQNWTQQYFAASYPGNPDHIYMLNGNTGFISTSYLFKTTNSGLNWISLPSENGFVDMYFIDSLMGWKLKDNYMKKTIDGGLNWQTQILPSGGMLISSLFFKFSNINKDTIWGVGGTISFGLGNYRGIIWRTTNGGDNWGFQIPDTSIHINTYWQTDFTNKLNGWAYHFSQGGVHTVTGGNDTTYYTGVNNLSSEIPKGFILYQNYPNPFNPVTKIRFKIPKASFIKLIVYDILGKEVSILVNERLNLGSYEVDWDAKGYMSGVYFYRLETEKFSETKKMLLIK